jgi:hypothetical protein
MTERCDTAEPWLSDVSKHTGHNPNCAPSRHRQLCYFKPNNSWARHSINSPFFRALWIWYLLVKIFQPFSLTIFFSSRSIKIMSFLFINLFMFFVNCKVQNKKNCNFFVIFQKEWFCKRMVEKISIFYGRVFEKCQNPHNSECKFESLLNKFCNTKFQNVFWICR